MVGKKLLPDGSPRMSPEALEGAIDYVRKALYASAAAHPLARMAFDSILEELAETRKECGEDWVLINPPPPPPCTCGQLSPCMAHFGNNPVGR